jgi:hypothetical protein
MPTTLSPTATDAAAKLMRFAADMIEDMDTLEAGLVVAGSIVARMHTTESNLAASAGFSDTADICDARAVRLHAIWVDLIKFQLDVRAGRV